MKPEPPLAERLRPKTLAGFVGQPQLTALGKPLRTMVEGDIANSIILWGPPGSGKTTLAAIIAHKTQSHFINLSTVETNTAEVKKIIGEAKERLILYHQKTILFLDEIHRFSKTQQDVLLPHVERGTIILIGATTENPSFEVIGPLLSRCRVYTLERLSKDDLRKIVDRALKDSEQGLGKLNIEIEPEALTFLVEAANGDARIVLNTLEITARHIKTALKQDGVIRQSDVENVLQSHLLYDRAGEEHYNTISAFIKSMRGSDPDAALYYLARMLEAGEDPLFIARRIIIFASEDIGNADPEALNLALTVFEACDRIGLPECKINLAHGVTYLTSAPKSNASYLGLMRAEEDVRKTLNEKIPLHLRNAPTKLMKNLGYGKEYQYPHNFDGHVVKETYLPENLAGRQYYHPTEQGFEKIIKTRLENLKKGASEKTAEEPWPKGLG